MKIFIKKINRMKFFKFLFLLVLFVQANAKAQDIDTVNYLDYNTEFFDESEEEYEISDEEKIFQDESDESREIVLYIEDLLNYAIYLNENDSLTYRYAKYKDNEEFIEYEGQLPSLEDIEKRFELVDCKEENSFFYCKEYIYNQNKAWDFIYERLYDSSGELILFIRHYNTYNSVCAEVAFERSEYYWDKEGNLIKKTYEIYDSNNNSLNIEDCWMEREFYDKYMDLSSFNSVYPFPFLSGSKE